LSSLYISEYQYAAYSQGPAIGAGDGVPCGLEPQITTQVIPISGTSAQSAALNPLTHFVRLHTDSVCSVAFGANPTATTSSMRLAANQTEFFGVSPEQGSIKIAVISNV
jgi:hypothetical protein